jgi:putative transposase
MLTALRPEKVWWTAAEVAEARLPDVPATRKGVELLAKRFEWRSHPEWSRQRSGKGGGWEYNWQLFPIAARRKLLKEAKLPDQEWRDASPDLADLQAYYESLPEGVKAKAQYRKKVLCEVLTHERSGLTRFFAVGQVALMHDIGDRTIWNWFKLVRGYPEADWLYLLAPRNKAGARKEPKAQCSPEFMDHLKGLFLQLEGPTFAQAYRDAKKIARNNGWAILCDRTARRRLNEQVPRVVQVYAREGIAGLERCFPPMIRSKLDMHAMEHVNADCHKFDVFTEWEAAISIAARSLPSRTSILARF